MNSYKAMKIRHQKEVNELPLGFAFSNRQFEEMMQRWGLSAEKDLDKICRISAGGFVQKKDLSHVKETLARHNQELDEAIKNDTTGDGFIFDMFVAEMEDHEYNYTGDPEETLDAIGFTFEQVQKDKCLARGFRKAHRYIMKRG